MEVFPNNEFIKGVVERDSKRSKVGSVDRSSFSVNHCHFIFRLKGNMLFKSQNLFQRLKTIYLVYPFPWFSHCKELVAECPFTLMADNFPHYLLETISMICSGNSFLIEEIGILLLARFHCSRRFISTVDTIVTCWFPLSADWLLSIRYLQQAPGWDE